MRLLLLIAGALLLLFIVGSLLGGGGEEKRAPEEIRLILYEAAIYPMERLNKILLNAYNEAPTEFSVNGVRPKVEVLQEGERVEWGGRTYYGVIGIYDPDVEGKLRVTDEARLMIVRITYEQTEEKGREIPVVKVGSPLLSILFLGTVSKNVELPVMRPVIILESGRYVPRMEVLEGNCEVDVRKGGGEGVCMFIYPASDRVREILFSMIPSREEFSGRLTLGGFGYPVGKVVIR